MQNLNPARNDKLSTDGYTLAEAGAVILLVGACLLFGYVPKAYRYTGLFLTPSLFSVYIFACGKGLLSKLLQIDPIVWIGNLSGYAFLIHLGALHFGGALVRKLFPAIPQPVVIIISAAATILCAVLYQKLITLAAKRKKN